MSERGVFAVDRGIFTDPDFAKEPFTEREAFMWLVSEAAWKARKVRAGSSVIELRRGQSCHSIRFMAEAWQWSKSRVDRFLGRLEKRDMIKTESGTGHTVVTICKYDAFQRTSLPARDSGGTDGGTATGQQRDKLEDNKNIEGNRVGGRANTREAFPANAFSVFWSRYPHKIGEDAAREAFERVEASDQVTFRDLMLGLERYCHFKPLDRRWCNPATFLREGRWKDQPAPEPSSNLETIGPRRNGGGGLARLLTRSMTDESADRTQRTNGSGGDFYDSGDDPAGGGQYGSNPQDNYSDGRGEILDFPGSYAVRA